MIPIKIKDKKTVETNFLNIVQKVLGSSFIEINREIKTVLGLNTTFEHIVTASFAELKLIKQSIASELFYESNKKDLKPIWVKVKKAYEKIRDEEIESTKLNIYLVNKLSIKVCPYCNRNYIENRGEKTTAQLDHFYGKSKLPIFALSLYNLIPVCYACNHIKQEREINISPYQGSFDFNNSIQFSFIPNNSDFIQNSNCLIVELRVTDDNRSVTDDEESLVKNIRNLHIDESYKTDNDYVGELIKKAILYNREHILYLLSNFQELFSSEEEIMKIVFGNYIGAEDFSKRPLAKLTYDILKELGITE